LQVENASLWSTGNDASLTANAYYDGSNYKYIASSGASRQYHNTDGSIAWAQASSGTAGNNITFAERMRIDSSGNVDLYQGKNLTWRYAASSTIRGSISVDSADNITFSNTSSNTERMRINDDGHLLVGVTNGSADVGGTTTGIRLGADGQLMASSSGTGTYNYPAYFDRRGTNNTGDSIALGLLGYLKSSIGVIGTSAGTDDGGITFNTWANNVTRTERMRIDASGYIQMGTPISTHIGTSQLFVNRGVNAAAATSGTAQTGGALRLRGGDNAVLDMGMNSVNTWIQATDRANLANGYSLALNPNGGNVGIGTPTPTTPFEVHGGASMTGGWGRTATLAHNFPVLVYQSKYSTDAFAGIGYDNSTGMKFWVNSPTSDLTANSQQPALTILDNKKIGIGIQNPAVDLHVYHATSHSEIRVGTSGSSDAKVPAVSFNNSSVEWGIGVKGDNHLHFRENTASYASRLTIADGGNVGITTSTASLVIGAAVGSTSYYSAVTSGTGIGIYAHGSYASCGAHYESATEANSNWSPFYVNKINWTSGHDARWMSFGVNGYTTDSATISYDGTNFAIVNGSDYRLKENIVAYTGGLAKINAIGVKSFNKIDGVSSHITQEGFIAHELQEVIPLAVIGEKDAMKVDESGETVPDYQTVNRETLIPYLVSAIQEQQTLIESLKARIEALEG
jgi:hypothetical protein